MDYENGGLYILLTPLDATKDYYHWGLFFCVSNPYGIVFEATNATGPFKFVDSINEDVPSSPNIVAALQIGEDIFDDVADRVENLLRGVPVIADASFDSKWGQNFSCLSWVLEAFDRLRKDKLIPDHSAREIEEKALALAKSATSTGTRKMDCLEGLNSRN